MWMLEDQLIEAALGRPPTVLEGQLLYREPRCAVCYDREIDGDANKMTTCGGCRVVVWCSEHAGDGAEGHTGSKGPDGRTQVSREILTRPLYSSLDLGAVRDDSAVQ